MAILAPCLFACLSCGGGDGRVDLLPFEPPGAGLPGIAPDGQSIAIGDSLRLRSSFASAGVQWRSEQPLTASISGTGLVRGIAPGRASIVAYLPSQGSDAAWTFVYVFPALCSAGSAVGSIVVGQTVGGTLSLNDCGLRYLTTPSFSHGSAAGWRFTVDSSASVRIDLDHAWYCSHLIVTDTVMDPVAETAGCDGGDRSLTRAFLPGVYLIWASTMDAPAGTYTLTTTALSP